MSRNRSSALQKTPGTGAGTALRLARNSYVASILPTQGTSWTDVDQTPKRFEIEIVRVS